MKSAISLLLVCLSTALVRAQTQTIVDAAGETVVVAVTLNPLGLPTTQTLQTLDAGDVTETETSTSTGTTTAINQGPVAQPAPTQTGQTAYTYTTTDAAGNTEVLQGIYTFSTAIDTGDPVQTMTGTVLDYSSWLNIIGTNTVAVALDDSASSALCTIHFLPSRKVCAAVGAALLSGAVGGAWLVLV